MSAFGNVVAGLGARIAGGVSAATGIVAAHRRAAVIAGSVVLLAAAGVAGWGVWGRGVPAPPAPQDQTPEQVRDYLASKEFAAQPEEVRQAYFEKAIAASRSGDRRRGAFRPGDLTAEQREQLRRNVGPLMQNRMNKRMEEFFALPPEQRTAYLDNMIDRMVARRDEMAARRQAAARSRPPEAQRSRPPEARTGDRRERRSRRRRHGFTPERLKRRIEHTPPEVRARWMEFHKAFVRRMQERGIEFRPHGRSGPPR